MSRKLILICGQMQMAKTTIADYIHNRISDKFIKRNFADAIKDKFCELFGVDKQFIEEWKNKPEIPPGFNVPVRQALQMVGDGFRAIKSDVWINLTLTGSDNLIIADGRYLNELKNIKDLNGLLILVYRKGYRNYVDNDSEKQIGSIIDWFNNNDVDEGIVSNFPKHVSNGANMIDIFLKNDDNIENLYKKVDNIVLPYLSEYFDPV